MTEGPRRGQEELPQDQDPRTFNFFSKRSLSYKHMVVHASQIHKHGSERTLGFQPHVLC